MSDINIKMLSEDALIYAERNVERVADLTKNRDDNSWIKSEFPQPMFVEKRLKISDFEIAENPGSSNREIDYKNGIAIYEALKGLPRYILTDNRFWLWLEYEKFYKQSRGMIAIKDKGTFLRSWLLEGEGKRRTLLVFGVLSRLFYRVKFSIDLQSGDKYHLTRWAFENQERYRNLTFRTFSSETQLVRGALKGEMKAVSEKGYEVNEFYPKIAKYISAFGSARLLDVISEDDIAGLVYRRMMDLYKEKETTNSETIR